MSQPAAQSTLEYALPPTRWNRRRWRRLASLALVVAILAASFPYGPNVARIVRRVWAERRCRVYVAPPGELACSEPLPYAGETPPFDFGRPEPSCLTDLRAEHVDLGPTAAPLIFMHERRTPSGERRLVILRRTPPDDRRSWDIPLSFLVMIIDPAILSPEQPHAVYQVEAVPDAYGDGRDATARLLFFAGQPDPADASHFTVQYELRGRKETLDGWLTNDMTVRLLQRFGNSPAKP